MSRLPGISVKASDIFVEIAFSSKSLNNHKGRFHHDEEFYSEGCNYLLEIILSGLSAVGTWTNWKNRITFKFYLFTIRLATKVFQTRNVDLIQHRRINE